MTDEQQQGLVFRIMDQGGPTDDREPYVAEAAAEIARSKALCRQLNSADPADPACLRILEELFRCKLEDATILTPFYCDMGIRVRIGRKVFIN